jgi:phage-related minor tail protein
MGNQVEYGIRISVSGNKAVVDGINEITQAATTNGDAAVAATKKTTTAQQDVIVSATKVSQSYTAVGESVAKSGAAVQQVTQKTVTANQQATASTAQLNKEQQQFIDTLTRQTDAIGKTASQLALLRAQELGVSDAAAPMIARLAATEQNVNRVGMSAAATAAAMRNVPAQFTDIVVSLQAGQSPMTVMLQQGGQLKDMFGGVGNAAKALGTYVLGLISPLAVGAAAVGVLAFACYQGSKEIESYQRAIIMTGNIAGVTADQMADVATRVNAAGKGTKSAAAEVLTAMVSSGQVASGNLEKFAGVALKMQKVIGMSVDDIAKDLSELGKSPLEASKKLSEQYHYLTKETYDQIKALMEHGKAADAAAVAQTAYINSFNTKADKIKENLGLVEKGWVSVRDKAKEAWDAFLGLGRGETKSEELARTQMGIANRQSNLLGYKKDSQPYVDTVAEIATLQEREKLLKRLIGLTGERADAEGKAARAQETAIKQGEKLDSYINSGSHQTRVQALKEETKKFEEATAGLSKTSVEYRQALAANAMAVKEINEKFKDKNSALQKQENAYQTLIMAMKEKSAASQAELQQSENLTEGQKLRIKFDTDLREGKLAATTAQREFARSLASQIDINNLLAATEKEQLERTKKFHTEFAAKNEASVKMAQANETYVTALSAANEQSQLEVTLLGKTETQRKIAIEQFKVEVALRKQIKEIENSKGFEVDKQTQIQVAKTAANQRKQEIVVEVNTEKVLKARKELDDFLDPARAQSFGDALAGALGTAGNALQKLSSQLQEYVRTEAELAKAKANAALVKDADPVKYAKDLDAINERSAKSQITNYGNIAGAAKTFFSEQSRGYKVLQTAEQIFQATQLAMTLSTMAAKLLGINTVTAATVAAEGTKNAAVMSGVGVQVAADQVKGASAASVAVATQAAGDPYTAWVRMAAMAAAMAALGFAVGGFGNGGGGGKTAEQQQREQGTGSVFGDADAKSESIKKTLELLKSNSDILLPINQGMLSSLRAIEASMAGLSNLIVRTGGITDGSNLGIKTGVISNGNAIGNLLSNVPIIGGLLGGLANLWGKTTQSIIDSGLQFAGSIADLQRGIGYSQYASVNTTTSSWFGLKKDTTNSVVTQGISQEIAAQFGLIFTNLEVALKAAAKGLGSDANAVSDVLKNLRIDNTVISLQGLKGQALTDAVNAVISKTMDTMSAAVFAGLDAFRQVGEGYTQTVMRVASGVELAKHELDKFGITAIKYTDILNKQGDVGGEIVRQSLMAAEGLSGVGKILETMSGTAQELAAQYQALMDLRKQMNNVGLNGGNLGTAIIGGAGGTKELADGLSSYQDQYFSDAEKAAILTRNVAAEFAKLGIAMPANKEALRALIERTGTGTDASAKLTGQLLKLAGSFATATDAAAKLKETQIQSVKDTMDSYKGFADGLRKYQQGLLLGSSSTLTPQEKYNEAKRQYEATLAAAKGGDADAQQRFQGVANAFLEASRVVNSSSGAYAADFQKVMSNSEQMAVWADQQVNLAKSSLDALKQQITATERVEQAVRDLRDGWSTHQGIFAPDDLRINVDIPAPSQLNLAKYGQENTVALVEEIKQLREELVALREDQQEQTQRLIDAGFDANHGAAAVIAESTLAAAKETAWVKISEGVIKK